MKKILAAALAVCCSLLSVQAPAQTAPSGRTIVYPLENQPSVDSVLAPARFTRLAMGSWMLHVLQLGGNGNGVYANCSTAPGTGLFVTVAPTLSGSACGLYQVTADDANPIPVGFTPQLAADPTLIVVQALQTATSSQLGPMTAPGAGLSVYWLVEAQIQTTDVSSSSRAFLNSATGAVSHNTVPTQRQDAIVYQLKQGTPASSSPVKPTVDAGFVAISYALIPNGKTQVLTGDISVGSLFTGFSSAANTVALAAAPSPTPQTGNAAVTGTIQAQGGFYGPGSGITGIPIAAFTPLPIPTGFGGTGVTNPAPTATATACGTAVSVTGAFPNQQVNVPVCPSPYPTPTASATAVPCGSAVSATGLTVSVPVCPSPYPTPAVTVTSTPCGAAPTSSGLTVTIPVCANPLPLANGGTGTAAPAPTATATACGGSVSVSGSFPSQQVNVPVCPTPNATASTPITIGGSYPNVQIGCDSAPFACAVLFQASAYGVTADGGVTENGALINTALAAICAQGGGTLMLPYNNGSNRIGIGVPIVYPCSTVHIMGYGRGYGGGSGHYNTAIAPSSTLYCLNSLGGSPMLSFYPATVEQTSNGVTDLGFDGNNDTCAYGLYAIAQQQPYFERLSFTGFSGIAMHLQGGSIGGLGLNQGSIIHPYFNQLQFSEQHAGDGQALVIDATPYPEPTGSPPNDMGDVFSGSGGNIGAVCYHPNCIVIGRSDHLYISDIQANFPSGAPTPTPAPSGSPSATPFPLLGITCGAEGDVVDGNNLVQTQVAVSLQGTSVGATCPPPWNPANGIVLHQQTYSNGAQGPSVDANSNLAQVDDHGNIYLSQQAGHTFPLYMCFGLQSFGASACAQGTPTLQGDTLNNLSIGVRGTSQSSNILFAPGGSGNGTTPTAYQSFIDSTGALACCTVGSESGAFGFFAGPIISSSTGSVGIVPIGSAMDADLALTHATTNAISSASGSSAVGLYLLQEVVSSANLIDFGTGTANSPTVIASIQANGGSTWGGPVRTSATSQPFVASGWSGYNGYNVGIGSGGAFTPVPSPTPAPTSSPIGAGCITVSGSYPYTLTCPQPVATATAGANVTTSGSTVTIGATGFSQYQTTGFFTTPAPTTSPNTYVQVGATLSGTTPVSNGPTGKWLAHIELPLSQDSVGTTQNTRGCIEMPTSASIVVQDNTQYTHASVCKVAPPDADAIAGSPAFGASTNGGGQSLSGTAFADVYINSSTAWSVKFYFAIDAITTQVNVNGFGSIMLIPI